MITDIARAGHDAPTAAPARALSAMIEPDLIRLEGVRKIYGRARPRSSRSTASTSPSRRGEFVAVLGPSGSGKSTAMNILGCLDTPTAGHYFFRGIDVGSLSRDERALLRRNHIGFVFQGFNLLEAHHARSRISSCR